LSVLAEALAVVDKNEERHYEAELYWLAGELSLRMGEPGRRRGKWFSTLRFSDSPILLRKVPPFSHSPFLSKGVLP
jgi:hypothetical protein